MWRVWCWIQGLRSHLWRWGFCTIRSLPPACRRRVVALLVQFPPRLVAVSLESRSRPGPSALSDPSGERRIFDDGGFCTIRSIPPACRRRVVGVSRLYWCNSPRLVAVRSRFGAAWRPNRRPPRRQTPTMGCRGRGGLRFGQNGARPGMSLAREPAIACANRLFRTSTRYSVSGRGCPRSY